MDNIFDIVSSNSYFDNNEEEVVTEAVTPDTFPYMKMMRRQVILPQGSPIGRGNLCFLYSNNLSESINMMNNTKNFSNRNRYNYYYYNFSYIGKIYNKMFKFRELDKRKDIYKEVSEKTKIIPRVNIHNTANDNKNMYYELYRYLEIFTNICSNLQPMKYITLYWDYIGKILSLDLPGYKNRFVLVNLKNFSLSGTYNITENLKNPLFLIYYTLFRKPELVKNIDIDFFFYVDNKVLKINPSNTDDKSYTSLRAEMKKMMSDVVKEEIIDKATDDISIQNSEIVSNVASTVSDFTKDKSYFIGTDEELKSVNEETPVEKEIKKKAEQKTKETIDTIGNMKVDTDEISKSIESNIRKEIDSDRELLSKVYYQNKSSKSTKSAASTARDKLLREEQKNIKVGNMTLAEIEKIKANKIEIPVDDVSRNLRTTNENMKQIRFENLDKTYNEKLMKKDITDAIVALNDKSIPMFIRDIQIKDTSDELNYKDTYTIYLEDANRKRHTIKVDIPKFIDDRFLYIGGNKKIIKHQSFYLPVVKIKPNMVQIVTNYSKMTIERVDNKSISSVERLKKLIPKNEEVARCFVPGNAYVNNLEFVTTLEYDDLSKVYDEFKYGKTYVMFDQNKCKEYMDNHNIKPIQGKVFIGLNNGKPSFIDMNTQEDENNNSVVDIIVNALPQDFSSEFNSVKPPKRLMYTKVRIMKQFVSVGMLLGLWEGLSTLLKKLKVEYRVEDKVPSSLSSDEDFLKFSDCVLVYKQDIPTALIMNGIRMFDTSKYKLVDLDERFPFLDYMKKVYGNTIIENALMNFYEFTIDPITMEILKELDLPTDIVNLYIYAVNLLADSQYTFDINQNFSRIRCNEIIPAILYERLSKNYVTYRNSNGRKKFTIPQDCVIKEILSLKTVEDYSTLNPTLEMEMLHAVSTKGFRGVNLDESYTMERRGYDPSMTGIISPSTSPDGQCGISRSLTLEPNITNIRGIIEDKHENLEDLKDINLFSPGELSIPLGATTDDPTRLG